MDTRAPPSHKRLLKTHASSCSNAAAWATSCLMPPLHDSSARANETLGFPPFGYDDPAFLNHTGDVRGRKVRRARLGAGPAGRVPLGGEALRRRGHRGLGAPPTVVAPAGVRNGTGTPLSFGRKGRDPRRNHQTAAQSHTRSWSISLFVSPNWGM